MSSPNWPMRLGYALAGLLSGSLISFLICFFIFDFAAFKLTLMISAASGLIFAVWGFIAGESMIYYLNRIWDSFYN